MYAGEGIHSRVHRLFILPEMPIPDRTASERKDQSQSQAGQSEVVLDALLSPDNASRKELLAALFGRQAPAHDVLVVVAHPDDEIICAGAQLPFWSTALMVHVTDGAPHQMADALAAGFNRREDYAVARQKESLSALAFAGIRPEQLRCLGVPDQGASFELAALAELLRGVIAEVQPYLVLTHPYEGGHPDHDATAFAVHAATGLLQGSEQKPFLIEMASYFNRAGAMATGEFLPDTGGPCRSITLTPSQRRLKQRMFDCFVTQQNVLQYFALEREAFRAAPQPDFASPPHPGKLYYELHDWGIRGREWRREAAAALNLLGLPGKLSQNPLLRC